MKPNFNNINLDLPKSKHSSVQDWEKENGIEANWKTPEMMMVDPPLLQDCIWRLEGLPVLFVTLKPPYEALMERLAQREIGNRFANSNYSSEQVERSRQRLERLRPWFYEAVYANDCCDLEIDTTQHEPEAVCDLIEQRRKRQGDAFKELRQRFPNSPWR